MRALMCMVSVLCVLTAGVSGCRSKASKAERQALREAALRQEVEAQFAEAAELQAGGQAGAAMEVLEKGFANAKFKAYRPRFFAQKVDLLLAQDKAGEAGELIVKAWAKEPRLAQVVFGRVRAYYQGKHDDAALLAWGRRLLDMGKGETLPKHLRPQVLEWLLASAMALDDTAATADAVDRLLAGLEPKVAAPRLQQAVNALIGASKFEQAAALIAHLASHRLGSAQEYKDLVVTANLRNRVAAKDWPEVPGAFEACAAQLADDALLGLLRQMFTALRKSQQMALVEDVCKRIFLSAPSKKVSAGYAARSWVELGMMADKKVLPERLTALLDADVLPRDVADSFERHFYQLVEDTEAIKKLYAIGERIKAVCTDKETVDLLEVKLLEGAFITENYDLALEMLERGIADKPKAWHDMAIPKTKAHRALAQGKPLEAIGFFRAFMAAVRASGMEEEHDPTTGVAYSQEWLLGRNAHRIAGIYASIPDPENAAKAREEAKALFDQGFKKAGDDAETLKVLQEELKALGL